MQTRVNDTYLVIEVPLSAASVAKSAGALGAHATKRRCAAIEVEGAIVVGCSSATLAGAEEGVLPALDSSSPSVAGTSPGPDYARLEQLILETQGEICQIETRVMSRLDSIQSSFEIYIAQQIEQGVAVRAEEAIRY